VAPGILRRMAASRWLHYGLTNILRVSIKLSDHVFILNFLVEILLILIYDHDSTDQVLNDSSLNNKIIHNLYSSPSINKMIQSRRIRWAGSIERMGRRGMHIRY
jgi:hypothetical protein